MTRGKLMLLGLLLAIVGAIAWVPVRCHFAIGRLESGGPAARMEAIAYLEEHRDRDFVLLALCRAAVADEDGDIRQRAFEAADRTGAGRKGNCYLALLQSDADGAARVRAAQHLEDVTSHVRGSWDAIIRIGGLDASSEVRRGVSEVARRRSSLVSGRARHARDVDTRRAALRVLTHDRSARQLRDALLEDEPVKHAHEIAVRALLDREGPARVSGLWRALRASTVPLTVRADVVKALAGQHQATSDRFLVEFSLAPPETHRAIGASIAAADEELRRAVGAALLEQSSDAASLQRFARALDSLGADDGEPSLGTLDLAEALEREVLMVDGRGSGLRSVRVELVRISRAGFEVRIPPGTIFVSSTKAQNMLITGGETFSFTQCWAHEAHLKAACAQIRKRVPREKDAFEGRVQPPSGDLGRIAPLLDGVAFPVQQAAVWIVASDVKRKDLDLAREFYESPPLVPGPSSRPIIRSHHVIEALQLLERAGLDVTRYQIHAWYQRNKKG